MRISQLLLECSGRSFVQLKLAASVVCQRAVDRVWKLVQLDTVQKGTCVAGGND